MNPEHIGRKLGIYAKVSARVLRSGMEANPAAGDRNPSTAAAPLTAGRPIAAPPAAAPPIAARPTFDPVIAHRRGASLGTGVRRFAGSLVGPFARAGHSLTLEIAGVFFALFCAYFTQAAYKLRGNGLHGPAHARFLLYGAVAAAFLWFSVSSFVRARRRMRR